MYRTKQNKTQHNTTRRYSLLPTYPDGSRSRSPDITRQRKEETGGKQEEQVLIDEGHM